LGCGKGRALVVAAHYGFLQLTGVEFAKELCEVAEKNTSQLYKLFPNVEIHIIRENAAEYEFEKDCAVLFLFNPFKEEVMKKVIKNIQLSLQKNPRELFVVYINPVLKDLFLDAGFEE